jgi:hypothetical protein
MAGIEGVVGDWANNNPDGRLRWSDPVNGNGFVQHFRLQNVDGSPAPYANKSIYFLPDCTDHLGTGGNGRLNFGILACLPALVK